MLGLIAAASRPPHCPRLPPRNIVQNIPKWPRSCLWSRTTWCHGGHRGEKSGSMRVHHKRRWSSRPGRPGGMALDLWWDNRVRAVSVLILIRMMANCPRGSRERMGPRRRLCAEGGCTGLARRAVYLLIRSDDLTGQHAIMSRESPARWNGFHGSGAGASHVEIRRYHSLRIPEPLHRYKNPRYPRPLALLHVHHTTVVLAPFCKVSQLA